MACFITSKLFLVFERSHNVAEFLQTCQKTIQNGEESQRLRQKKLKLTCPAESAMKPETTERRRWGSPQFPEKTKSFHRINRPLRTDNSYSQTARVGVFLWLDQGGNDMETAYARNDAEPMSAYSVSKLELLKCIDELRRVANAGDGPCAALREKIEANAFNLVVVGQFKRGKTSLINALLGADILPVAVVPLTSIVTQITYGDAMDIKVFFNDGRALEIGPENLANYVTEKGNPKNGKDVNEVVITYPSPYLKDGVRLIDTPGVGSIYQHNTDVAYQYLPKSDAALFILSVDQPMAKAELDFLKDVREYSNKIFFLLNKIDYFNESEWQESLDFSRNVLTEAMGSEVRIFPVSARLALEGKINNCQEKIQKSLLPRFAGMLNAFLMEEKGKILIVSAAGSLLRLISQRRLELDLELKSLTTPLDELQQKIKRFEAKKKEVVIEKQDFTVLMDDETKRLIQNTLDADLMTFRKDLLAQEEANLEEEFNRLKTLSSRKLRDALQQTIIEHARHAFHTWRAIEDDRLAKAFETICKRFVIKINDTVDTLLKFSSDLFNIPYEVVKTESLWTVQSGFYYKFQEQPVGLEIVASSLTLALPKFIGSRIILKKMHEYLFRVLELQTARVGYDFEKRLDKSKLEFRWAMLQKIEATIEGIEKAVEKGMTLRSKGSENLDQRGREIEADLQTLAAIRARLIILMNDPKDSAFSGR